MFLARFKHRGRTYNGVLYPDRNVLVPIRGSIFGEREPTGGEIWVGDVELLPPVVPSKIVCVGKNYADHAREMKGDVPEEPIIFLKPPSAVIGSNQAILKPSWAGRVDYEGELALIIGKTCKDVSPEEAPDYIGGLTCFNDVTARDLQKKDGQWTRGKSFDTFAPMGPWMVDTPDWAGRRIRTRLNGAVVQDSTTDMMVFNPFFLVSFISRVMTLYPGDVIATGTPAGVGPLQGGDEVEVEVEGIGVLKNHVVEV